MIPRSQTLKVEDFPDQSEWIEPLLRALNQGATQTSQALSSQLTFSENFNATIQVVTVTLRDDWTAVAFDGGGGWANAGGGAQDAQYRKVGDLVQVRGTVASGTIGAPVCTLPAGFRPPAEMKFATVSSAVFGAVSVASTGEVVPLVGSNTAFHINCTFGVPGPTTPNGAFPIKFTHGLTNGAKPVGCWVIGVSDVTGSARNPLSGAAYCGWRPNGSEVLVDDIPGLYPGRKYEVTFLVSGG